MDYTYANGVINALETKVLDRNKLFVLNKYEKDEIVKVLISMNYGNNTQSKSLEDLIHAENVKLKEVIESITPSKNDTDLFYLLNDAQNIKVLYKIKKYNLNKFEYLSEGGALNVEGLQKAILDNDFSAVSKNEKKLIESINSLIETIDNPKILSATIDNELYQYALKMTKDKILVKYLKAKIDIANVTSMFRAKQLGWSKEEYLEMVLNGGMVDKDKLTDLYEKSKEEQSKALASYYNEGLSKVLNKASTMNAYQIEFNRLLMDIMKEFSNDPFSIGPIIYYYLLKQAEAQNIRILYSGNKVDIKDLI